MSRPPHGLFDHLAWALAAWVYGGPVAGPLPRRKVFRLAVLGSAALLTAVVLRHGGFPLAWHRIGTALWLAAALVMMRGERNWGDPRLSTAAAAGLAAAIGGIAGIAILGA